MMVLKGGSPNDIFLVIFTKIISHFKKMNKLLEKLEESLPSHESMKQRCFKKQVLNITLDTDRYRH